MTTTVSTRIHRAVTVAAAVVCSGALLAALAPTAAADPTIHVTNLPSSEPTVTLSWHPAGSGRLALAATVSGTAARHLRVQRSWSCPDGTTGAARVAHKTFSDGAANLPAAQTMFQTNQTACTNPTPAPMLTVIVTRAGSSAAVTHYVNPTASGSWTNSADPFQTYDSATYDGETCQQTGPGQWTVSDSFTITGGVYELLDASTTANGDPDISPQMSNAPVGYDGGPDSVTFSINNVYLTNPSGRTVSYRICPNQGEAYLDVDFQFPDGTYAGEWELTHAWPTSIPSCN